MPHLDPGLLHELLDGEVPSTQLPPIQAHLAACAECRARLESERRLLTDVAGLVAEIELPPRSGSPAVRTPRRSFRTPFRPGLAWAATLVLAAGLGYLARGSGVAPGEHPVNGSASANSRTTPTSSTLQAGESVIASATRPVAPAARGLTPAPREALAQQRQRTDSGVPGAGGANTEARDQVAAKSIAGTSVAGQPAIAAAPPPTKAAEDRADTIAKPAAAVSTAGRIIAGGAVARTHEERRRADAPAANALMATQRLDSAGAAEPITLSEAIRRLGGTLRLIDGVVPLRLEWREPYVRVVYPAAPGELVLQQQLIDGRVVFQLVAPRGFPPDSLARLRARVKP